MSIKSKVSVEVTARKSNCYNRNRDSDLAHPTSLVQRGSVVINLTVKALGQFLEFSYTQLQQSQSIYEIKK